MPGTGAPGRRYDVLTRQMYGDVFQKLSKYGYITMDDHQVGGSLGIDIKSGIVLP